MSVFLKVHKGGGEGSQCELHIQTYITLDSYALLWKLQVILQEKMKIMVMKIGDDDGYLEVKII